MKEANKRITVLNINCQSVKSKVADSKLKDSKPSKNFLSFINNQKSENIGVSPLKVNGISKTNPQDQA